MCFSSPANQTKALGFVRSCRDPPRTTYGPMYSVKVASCQSVSQGQRQRTNVSQRKKDSYEHLTLTASHIRDLTWFFHEAGLNFASGSSEYFVQERRQVLA